MLATIIVTILIIAAAFFAIRKLIKDKKSGKCCGGCGGCSGECGSCHKER